MMTTQGPSNPEDEPPLFLHAELLPNIRHITLYVSIPATSLPPTQHPQISLSESRRAVSVSLPAPKDHTADTIKLPARVNEASRHILSTAPANARTDNGQREYSFRMMLDTNTHSNGHTAQTSLQDESMMDGFVPWTASDMGPDTRVRCRRCERLILGRGDLAGGLARESNTQGMAGPSSSVESGSRSTGWVWKDLPSGNWAEMMDFWHCHKPDPLPEDRESNDSTNNNGTGVDTNSSVKGYGAANQVVASLGTVLVDVASFLVAEEDCVGLKKATQATPGQTPDPQPQSILCENCNTVIGIEDHVSKGWRLFKTRLSVSTSQPDESITEESWQSHPPETIIAAQLLELIERESARRFVIHCGRQDGLLIWAFNPNLRYSSSSTSHSITDQQAMKVFFQDVADVDAMLHPESGKASSLALEELRLLEGDFVALGETLRWRNGLLPVSARTFREWQVGVLHRFER